MAKSKTWNDAILAKQRDYLREPSAKEAFDTLIATAIELPGYRVEPVWRKPRHSFDYSDAGSGERLFAFMVNQRDLKFHVRLSGLKKVPGGFAEFSRHFSTAVVNPRGEWTARIACKADAQRLNELLFSTARGPQAHGASRHWWVNHGPAFRQESEGGYLWSPKKAAGSSNRLSYDNMMRMMPGDVIYSFADGAIRAVGMALARAYEGRGEGGGAPGRQVSVRFRKLDPALRTRDHTAELAAVLPKKNAPIRANGEENPAVYLSAVPGALVATLHRLIGPPLDSAQRQIEESVGPEFLDDVEEARLQQRADLGPVEKETLSRARRGHGRYRQGVEKIESGCRLTGLIDRRHLRARHIKPWRVSADDEKLDPHNGLLMSPHIDHLFDRGYISFTDAGELMVSKYLNPVVLSDWGLTGSIESKPFGARQCVYLEFHRQHVFERHGRGKEREARDAELPSGGAVLREIVRNS